MIALADALPTAVRETTTLDQLADEIRQDHAAIGRKHGEALALARRAGERLIEVKEVRLKSKTFGRWLKHNCPFAWSTANNYMSISRNWDWLSNSHDVGTMTIGEALELIRDRDRESDDEEDADQPPPRRVVAAHAKEIERFREAVCRARDLPNLAPVAPLLRIKYDEVREALDETERRLLEDYQKQQGGGA